MVHPVIKVGDKVLFRRPDGELHEDTVRVLFDQWVLLEPYGKNYQKPAAVLTEHSWTFLENIERVLL